MAFDFKREFRELYQPKAKPGIVCVPPMSFVAVRGKGDPNEPDGDYKRAVEALYAVSYTVKMSKKGPHAIEGYFDFVVPPLEGFWWQEGVFGVDYANKAGFEWISAIRLPDFVTPDEFEWARDEAERKKKLDLTSAFFLTLEEGPCVQCLHTGSYDTEPATVELMHAFAEQEGYAIDITDERRHHEIYLSDPRRVAPERLKTVVRHPVRKV